MRISFTECEILISISVIILVVYFLTKKKFDKECPMMESRANVMHQDKPETGYVKPNEGLFNHKDIATLIKEEFQKTGCTKELSEGHINRFRNQRDFGASEMFKLCVRSQSGDQASAELCGHPTDCKVPVIMPDAGAIRDEYYNSLKYTNKKKTTIFEPTFAAYENLEQAKRRCASIIDCTGVVYSKIDKMYYVRGGELIENPDFESWIK